MQCRPVSAPAPARPPSRTCGPRRARRPPRRTRASWASVPAAAAPASDCACLDNRRAASGATRRHSCARARGPANPFSRATSRAIPVSDHRRSGSGFAPRAEACRSFRTNRRPSHSESWDDESHRAESEDAESPLLDDDAWPVDSLVGSSSGRAPSPRQRSLWAAFSSSKRFRRRRALANLRGRCCPATLSN